MIDEDGKTLWCGNLSEQVSEELLYELFLQAGPLDKVRIARDRDGRQRNFAFITYCQEVSVPYAISLFKGTALFHRTLSLQSRSQNAFLPPPIRCTLDPSFDFSTQTNVTQQFVEMTENMLEVDQRMMIQSAKQYDETQNNLAMASLQGKWQNRHHPYRNDGHDRRQDHRENDNNHRNGKYPHNRRNRNRNNYGSSGRNKGNDNYRRD